MKQVRCSRTVFCCFPCGQGVLGPFSAASSRGGLHAAVYPGEWRWQFCSTAYLQVTINDAPSHTFWPFSVLTHTHTHRYVSPIKDKAVPIPATARQSRHSPGRGVRRPSAGWGEPAPRRGGCALASWACESRPGPAARSRGSHLEEGNSEALVMTTSGITGLSWKLKKSAMFHEGLLWLFRQHWRLFPISTSHSYPPFQLN